MKDIRPLNSFKRDLKQVAKRNWDLVRLHRTIGQLQMNASLPPHARPHKLSGEYEGLWECHIESDWLLIYKITSAEVILARTGTHADLFE
jgi:mRNA interferase YafQ